jgi:hypothetical protein
MHPRQHTSTARKKSHPRKQKQNKFLVMVITHALRTGSWKTTRAHAEQEEKGKKWGLF